MFTILNVFFWVFFSILQILKASLRCLRVQKVTFIVDFLESRISFSLSQEFTDFDWVQLCIDTCQMNLGRRFLLIRIALLTTKKSTGALKTVRYYTYIHLLYKAARTFSQMVLHIESVYRQMIPNIARYWFYNYGIANLQTNQCKPYVHM